MKLKLDLHVHTSHSYDCDLSLDQIEEKCLEIGLDGYAVTDHDSIKGLSEAIARKNGLTVIPGLEVSAKGAHVLGLGICEIVSDNQGIQKTVDDIHEKGGLAVLAHPYGLPKSWVNMHKVEDAGFDAIETSNSSQIPYKIIENLNNRLAEKLHLPKTGGSDSHVIETIGRSYTVVETDTSAVNDILDAIKNGRCEAYGCGLTLNELSRKVWRGLHNLW
jgi:predicted metal-dependent phosphoesterase TrpH